MFGRVLGNSHDQILLVENETGSTFGNICHNPLTQNSTAQNFNSQTYTQNSSSLDKQEYSRNVLEDNPPSWVLPSKALAQWVPHFDVHQNPSVSDSVGLGRTQESAFLTSSQAWSGSHAFRD